MFRIIASIQPHSLSNIFCSKDNIDPSNCIDTSSTGVSYYDDFLDDSQKSYLERKNLQGHIDKMTPKEYYQACAKIFHSTVDSLIRQRRGDPDSMNWLSKRLESGQKFSLPYVNFANEGQEGLHRMLVLADKFGWDTYEFPVLVIDYIDRDKAQFDEIRKVLNSAINESLQYKYRADCLPDDLTAEIQWQLDSNEENTFRAICIDENSERFVFSIIGYENRIQLDVDKSDIQIRDEETEIDLDDIEVDDLDLDELLKTL